MGFGVHKFSNWKKSVAELGHSDPFTSDVDPNIYFHSNDLFSKTTALMVLKFHMKHYQTTGHQTDKIQPDRECKMATITKNSETNKIIFFSPEPLGVFEGNFVRRIIVILVFRIIKMKKVCSRIRSQWPTFCVRVQLCQNADIPRHLTDFSQIQSELSANGVVSNLCDWAIHDGRWLPLLK